VELAQNHLSGWRVRGAGSESFVRMEGAWNWLRIICEGGRCVDLAQNHL
jgi:hypothetical protein